MSKRHGGVSIGIYQRSVRRVFSYGAATPLNATVDIALAWWFHPDTGAFEHGGTLLGFTADTFFNPGEDIAVVVLSNVGPGTAVSAEMIGEHVRAPLPGNQPCRLQAWRSRRQVAQVAGYGC